MHISRIYMYINIYIYAYVYVYTYIHIYIYSTHIYVYTYIYTIYIYVCVCIYKYMYAYVYTYRSSVYVYAYMYICIYMRTYIHMYIWCIWMCVCVCMYIQIVCSCVYIRIYTCRNRMYMMWRKRECSQKTLGGTLRVHTLMTQIQITTQFALFIYENMICIVEKIWYWASVMYSDQSDLHRAHPLCRFGHTIHSVFVSCAEYRLFYWALLQKRPIIWRSLLIVATP